MSFLVRISGRIVNWLAQMVPGRNAHVAQLVERVLGKDEVISSNLIMGSINLSSRKPNGLEDSN